MGETGSLVELRVAVCYLFVMSISSLHISKYYRDCLSDELILDVVDKKNASPLGEAPADAFDRGTIPARTAEECVQSVQRKLKRDELESIPVLAAPVQLLLKSGHASSHHRHPPTITPLIVPCVLHVSGVLSPAPGKKPWIPRNYLEPLARAGDVAVSSVDALDIFLSGEWDDEACGEWAGYRGFCARMLEDLAGIAGEEAVSFSDATYLVRNTLRLFSGIQPFGAAMHIKALYEDIAAQGREHALYEALLAGHTELRPPLTIDEEAVAAVERHVGQMNGRFALGRSQREAMHHFLTTGDGEIVAVNGPPGTGKTTLLQSAIASLWVRSVMDAGDGEAVPPVIVASSTNNQAVTNVIRDFGEILGGDEGSPLARRWLPGAFNSLGAYALSASQQNKLAAEGELDRYLWLTRTGREAFGGALADLQGRDPIPLYEQYLASFAEFTGDKPGSKGRLPVLKHIRGVLRGRILKLHDTMKAGIGLWLRCRTDHEDRPGVRDALARASEEVASREEALRKVAEEADAVGKRVEVAKDLVGAAQAVIDGEPFWEGLLGFLGFVRKRRAARAQAFLARHDMDASDPVEGMQDVLALLMERLRKAKSALDDAQGSRSGAEAALGDVVRERDARRKELDAMEARLGRLNDFAASLCEGAREAPPVVFTREGLYAFLGLYDPSLRHEMFLLTVHYYEARWLEEMLKPAKGDAVQGRERWRRFAMLTPCVVSTLYMVPRFFRWGVEYHYDFIDLLILDEAGQVAPDKAAAVFSLARRALVVGDVHQIEPVYSLPPAVDKGNMREHGIVCAAADGMPMAMSSSGGNTMRLAQAACPFWCESGGERAAERGMRLLEHRRCHKDIIAYCRDLVYPDIEVHTRDDGREYPYPRMGYAHIPSCGARVNGSWANEYEAKNIADWLRWERESILDFYGDRDGVPRHLGELVSIVTPFKAQEKAIRRRLQEALGGEDAKGIVVGTVHRLQGAEKNIVIFSPVNGPGDVPTPFFDRGPNMLNVAVSRAKDSFLVFGNMSLFRKGDAKVPSQVLARHLFKEDASRELPGFVLAARDISRERVEHISTTQRHQEVLAAALEKSRREVVIVSPFLSGNAIETDGVLDKVRGAVRRGVSVHIYADSGFALKACGSRPELLRRVAASLRDAGAELRFADGLHNKTIVVDDGVLVEGSFNWLSASRDPAWARVEHSFLYRDASARGVKDSMLAGFEHILSLGQFR